MIVAVEAHADVIFGDPIVNANGWGFSRNGVKKVAPHNFTIFALTKHNTTHPTQLAKTSRRIVKGY
jgi:hypothetical protein